MNVPEWAKYVARDKDGALYTYVIKPTKGSRVWLYGGKYIWLPSELFPDVKWSDEEPTEIVQILMHERGGGMSKNKWESLLDSAISEIEYSIKTKHTKSEEVHEHYLTNAIRYIEEAKEVAE